MVRAVEHIGVLRDAELLDRREHLTDGLVHVAYTCRGGERLARQVRECLAGFLEALRRGLGVRTCAVVRELQEERLLRAHLLLHELDAALGDREALLRIGLAALRPLIRVRAVGDVEAVLRGVETSHVPLAEVRRRVADSPEKRSGGRHAFGDFVPRRRRDHALSGVGDVFAAAAPLLAALVDVGHVQLRRADAREEARARRRAARGRHVELAEAHALLRDALQVGREPRRARVARLGAVHVDGGRGPAVGLGEDEDEVRLRLAALLLRARHRMGNRHQRDQRRDHKSLHLRGLLGSCRSEVRGLSCRGAGGFRRRHCCFRRCRRPRCFHRSRRPVRRRRSCRDCGLRCRGHFRGRCARRTAGAARA